MFRTHSRAPTLDMVGALQVFSFFACFFTKATCTAWVLRIAHHQNKKDTPKDVLFVLVTQVILWAENDFIKSGLDCSFVQRVSNTYCIDNSVFISKPHLRLTLGL